MGVLRVVLFASLLMMRRRIGFCLGNRVGMVMGMKWWCSLSVGVFAFVCW